MQEMEITSLYLCSETLKTLLGARDGGRESWKGRRGIGYTMEERAPSAGHPWGLRDSYCGVAQGSSSEIRKWFPPPSWI